MQKPVWWCVHTPMVPWTCMPHMFVAKPLGPPSAWLVLRCLRSKELTRQVGPVERKEPDHAVEPIACTVRFGSGALVHLHKEGAHREEGRVRDPIEGDEGTLAPYAFHA